MTIAPFLPQLLGLLLAADPVPPFAAAAFDDFAAQAEFPSVQALRGVLLPVEGQPGEIAESSKLQRAASRFSGLFRYAEPWPDGSALRVSLVDVQSLAIHVWSGNRGVTLRLRGEAGRSGSQWIVYGTSRQGQAPRPEQLALWATDEGRYRRTGEGTFALHWADGLLAMTRGDVVFWRVPLEARPAQVYFDGAAIVRGVAMFASGGPPPAPADLPLVRDVPKPAELEWQETSADGATLSRLPEGGVELSAAARARSAQFFATVAPPGLHEIIFAVENAQPGTGVYLGDASGEPIARVAFFRPRGRAGVAFGLATGRGGEAERAYPEGFAIPYAGQRQWLRLLLAGGITRLWTSGDGRHWSQTPDGAMRSAGGCRTVGLYALADQSARSIRLRSLQVRRLDALAALAPERLVEQAAEMRPRSNSRRPNTLVDRARPADVPENVWRRALALRMIIECPNSNTGQSLVGRLLHDVMESPPETDAALRLLAQAARLVESSEDSRSGLGSLYDLVGRRLIARRDPAPFSRLWRAMLEAPLGGAPSASYGTPSPQLLRDQLLLAVYEGRWDDLAQYGRQLQFWTRSRQWTNQPMPAWEQATGPVIDWATAQLEAYRRSRQAPEAAAAPVPGKQEPPPVAAGRSRSRSGRPRPRNPLDATHPLVERLGKEAYNASADLEAALAGKALREACQIIRDAGPAQGLVPTLDPQLMVSLQVAVARAAAEQPELAKVMEEHFGPLAELRVKQAMDAADPSGVEAVAEQFLGTRAAGLAHGWLGDRSMAAGQFAPALAHYRRALGAVAPAEHASAAARLRLAAAMLGKSLGEPIFGTVDLGPTRMPGEDFERMIAGLVSGKPATEQRPGIPPAAGSQAIEARAWAQFPSGGEPRWWTPRRPLDLAARQTAIRLADQSMLVSTPTRLLAFNLADGRLRWTQSAQIEPDRLQAASGPAEPVVAGTNVFLRRPSSRGWELVSLSLSDGRVAWSAPGDVPVVSDPIPLGPYVFALVAQPSQAGRLSLDWAQFDAASGRLLGRLPAVELRDLWQVLASARALWADDTLVATAGGCVIACDAPGRVRWVRRQSYLAPQLDAVQQSRSPQRHEAPLVLAGRIYATQPGVWAVECIDLATGRLLWRRAEPELKGLAGVDSQRAVLETTGGLIALDAATGRELWFHEDFDQLDAGVLLDADSVLHATLDRPPEGRPEVVLEWLDAASGAVKSRVPLAIAWERRSAFGPLILGAGQLWAVLMRGEDGQREIVRLSTGGK